MKKNKLLKTAMVGAVAFTPVLAVGVNVDKASAATYDVAYANFIKDLYNTPALTANRGLLTTAHTELMESLQADNNALVKSMLDSSITANPAKEKAAVELVTSLFTTFSPTNVDVDFAGKFQSFKAANKTNVELLFGSGIDEEDLGAFAMSSHLAYYELVKALPPTAGTSAFIGAYGVALASDTNHEVYKALQGILKNKTAVIDALQSANTGELKVALDDALPVLVEALKQVTAPVIPPGPGVPTPPVTTTPGEVSTGADTVESNPQAVIDAINAAASVETLEITLTGTDTSVAIPALVLSALANKNSDATIVLASGTASYELPVAFIDAAAAATALGVASSELKLEISMAPVANPLANNAAYTTLSGAIDFKVAFVAPNGQKVEINVFPKPVTRSITTDTVLDKATTVGVTVDAQGNVKAVPTFVEDSLKEANLHRSGNSVYTLIKNSKTFNDVNNGKNWSEEYVEKLASRMIVNGTTATTYEPNRAISRGEFAAILARGLGLVAKSEKVKFTDVSSAQAFNTNGEIAAVVEAGIVKGDAKGKFRPYDEISRDEAAIMISRALDFIGTDGVKLDASKKVSAFTDYRYIGNTARPHVERVFQAGYLGGYSNGSFGASNDTERGQMAKILYNFLQSVKFIN